MYRKLLRYYFDKERRTNRPAVEIRGLRTLSLPRLFGHAREHSSLPRQPHYDQLITLRVETGRARSPDALGVYLVVSTQGQESCFACQRAGLFR